MSIYKTNFFDPQSAAEKAVSVIGYGYDLTCDIRLTGCKPGPSGSTLIKLDGKLTKDLVVPGGVIVSNVSQAVKCDKGDRTRFRSDVLSFNHMSEQFNQELSLSGKIPSGFFNSMFGYKGCWQKDAPMTKNLAFDGYFITLYNIELAKTQIALSEKVKQEVPSSWDPAALAEFIDKYGTHIVVGVKMGGKDVIYQKQLQSSNLEPTEVQNMLKRLADDEFSKCDSEASVSGSDKLSKEKDERSVAWDLPPILANSLRPTVVSRSKKDDLFSIHVRRGGIDKGQSHKSWLSTVSQAPNVISVSFVPIVALLSGVRGSGFLSHAINLYLRYKPPIEELEQFLEFQLPRQWAPAYGDLPLAPRRKKSPSPSLQFTFLGPRLYVNTTKVDTENRPVTGVRLYLEGRKSDRLAIHLQHLSSIPKLLELTDDFTYKPNDENIGKGYLEPVKWSIFSQVCALPVEHIDDSASIVTKAWFEVKGVGIKKVLFLRLGYSMVGSGKIRRSEWDGPTMHSRKSGLMSTLMSTPFSMGLATPEQKPVKVELNSAVYPDGPPLRAPKMSGFVDTREMVRGPEDPPGYWVVTGAKLCVEGGRIRVKVKYSLLTIMSEDSMFM
ncbi:MACPF domain-containing protein NSL1-like [Bidens hawaiensis]|uniref:MACPF domain-containing protein NSL1-like n=1 Tax=Bidens hawaiensis TaxID=980011 RepID=UPI004048F17B